MCHAPADILWQWDLGMITGGLEGGASWSAFVVDVGTNFFYIISHTFVVGALVSLHIYLRKTPESAGILSWIILAIIYIPITAFPMLMAYGPQTIMLYIIGFYAGKHPFYGSAKFAECFKAYYLIVFAVLIVLSMPTLLGRCDRYPPETIWERFRWYIVECVLTLAVLTRSIDVPSASGDPLNLLTPLGWWALWAFCSHVMFARTLPMPWGAVTTYLSAIPFVVLFNFILPAAGLGKKKDETPVESSVEPMLAKAAPAAEPPKPYGTFGGLFTRRARDPE